MPVYSVKMPLVFVVIGRSVGLLALDDASMERVLPDVMRAPLGITLREPPPPLHAATTAAAAIKAAPAAIRCTLPTLVSPGVPRVAPAARPPSDIRDCDDLSTRQAIPWCYASIGLTRSEPGLVLYSEGCPRPHGHEG